MEQTISVTLHNIETTTVANKRTAFIRNLPLDFQKEFKEQLAKLKP